VRVFVLCVLACLSSVACAPTEPVPPDVLVVLVPGLRADAAGQPGAEAAFLAAFDGWPRRRFTAAHAQSASAWVSLGSLLTGRYPGAIPLCGRVSDDPGTEQPWCSTLPPDLPTLPGVLELYGYRTAILASSSTGAPPHAEGFQRSLLVEPQGGRSDWTALAHQLADLRGGPEPLFAVLLLDDLAVQRRPDLRQAIGLSAQPSPCELGGQRPGHPRADGGAGVEVGPDDRPPESALSCRPDRWDPAEDGLPGEPVHSWPWGELDPARVREVYAEEAAALGRGVAGLLGDPLAPDAPRVVLSALHGISLGESSGSEPVPKAFAWSGLLLDRTLRVPLVMLGYGPPSPVPVAQPVELIDLLPTLLARTEARIPAGLSGRDLLAPGATVDPASVAYAEYGDMLYLRQGPWALTMRTVSHRGTALDPALTAGLEQPVTDGSYRLHNVLMDPFQERDRKAEQPALAEQLRALMAATRTGPAAPPDDPGTAARLLELRLQGSEGYW
jgi:hypothetical protein